MMPMRHTFRPPMDMTMPWKPASAQATAPGRSPEDEAEPAGEADTLRKNSKSVGNHDSDNDTESAASSDKDTAAPTLPAASGGGGVASSFARAGKRLWNSNPLSGLAALKKQHSRTVSDFSESDFSPFPPGTPVWTRYGLGTIVTTRSDDNFLIVSLQGQSRMTLYLNSADEDYYSVPAIRHDWVETPAGDGRVLSFDAKTQMYSVSIGNDSKGRVDVTVNVHRNDLRRVMPTRRQTQAPQPQTVAASTPQEASVIAKGINSALKTIVTTSSGLSTSTYQFVSNYYYQGQCVVTTYGSGTVVSLDQTNHRAQVQLTWGATAFLSTDAILHYTKAAVGMEVSTKFGTGIVTSVRAAEGMYAVQLSGSKDKNTEPEVVYVHESDLSRTAVGVSRTRLGSAQKHVKDKLGGAKSLLSFAQSKVKLFGQSSGVKDAKAPAPATTTPSPATTTPRPPSRSKSTRIVESDEDNEPSSAGI